MVSSASMLKKVPGMGVMSDTAPSLFKRHETQGPYRGVARFGKGRGTVLLEVADTPELRERGLMGRTSLPSFCGMLFTGLEGGAFWMKNCKMPLDIVFLEGGRVSRTYTMKPDGGARRYPYGDETEAIELPAGYCKRHGIGPGTACTWRTWS